VLESTIFCALAFKTRLPLELYASWSAGFRTRLSTSLQSFK
jgi:hypothetical protein